MIKAEVNLVGTVKRDATMRTDNKTNRQYLSFVMTVNIPDDKGKGRDMEVLVSMYNAHKNDVSLYVEKRRVVAQGSLAIRRKGEDYAFYLTSSQLSTKDVPEQDSITGELQFCGRLRNGNVCEVKTDRKGNPFLLFSAFSSEKVGENFISIWVRFIRFSDDGESMESIKPVWMQPKARISISGDFQISVYDNVFRFSCIVKRMEEYVKENNN